MLDAPGEVRCGAGFAIKLAVKNWSASPMELSLKEEQAKLDAILLDGKSGSSLGTVAPGGTLEMSLNLIAVSTGVHTVRNKPTCDNSVKSSPHPLRFW